LKRIALVIVSASIDFSPEGEALVDQFLGRADLRQPRQQTIQARTLIADHARSSSIRRGRCKRDEEPGHGSEAESLNGKSFPESVAGC
jgi:hypothetical protein